MINERGTAHCDWCHVWADDLGVYINVSCMGHGEQASEQNSSMVSASVTALTSSVMDCDWDVQPNKTFSYQETFGHVIKYHVNIKQTRISLLFSGKVSTHV